jgi:hypothetical protein
VADGWCLFVLRERYCWLVAGGWFVLREKYCWLLVDKPSELDVSLSLIIFDPYFRGIVDLFTIFLMVIGQPISPKSSESPKDLEFEFLSSLERMQGRKTADFMPLLRYCRWELSVLSVFIEQYASEPRPQTATVLLFFQIERRGCFLFVQKYSARCGLG